MRACARVVGSDDVEPVCEALSRRAVPFIFFTELSGPLSQRWRITWSCRGEVKGISMRIETLAVVALASSLLASGALAQTRKLEEPPAWLAERNLGKSSTTGIEDGELYCHNVVNGTQKPEKPNHVRDCLEWYGNRIRQRGTLCGALYIVTR